MKNCFLLFILLISFSAISQVNYETIFSEKLGEDRNIKIQLPRNYESNSEKRYPIFIVLDGDYLFEPVAGNVDFYSYWEDMPEAIVVGINQLDTRVDDGYFDDTNYFPSDTGANFFEFIGLELLPYLDKNYRTAKFVIAVGHDYTANFINYYLFKDPSLFQGYINLSPDFAPMMAERLSEKLSTINQKIWFYMATGTDDIKSIREDVIYTDKQLSLVENALVKYYYDDFEGATHYSLVGRAIPMAIEDIFSIYRPISNKEYKEDLLNTEGSLYNYLIEKYDVIESLFGLDNTIRVNDFQAISAAIEKLEKWNDYEALGKLARKEHPDTMLGNYYLGRFYEETGEPKKAMRTYQSAFLLKEIGNLTKDLMLEKADKIKADFGY
jgi:hypothetical protein